MKVLLNPLFHTRNWKRPTVVQGEKCVIGRAADCDLRLDTPLVSRRHCAVIVDGKQVRVRDLGSRNGTFVNCAPIRDECILKDGDALGVATVAYRVEIEATDAECSK